MKAIYFVRPIWRSFDFTGATGRAEYFTYAVTSFLITVLLTVAAFLFFIINWSVIAPPEMLNSSGQLLWTPPGGMMGAFEILWFVFQIPMLALTVRRLHDQNASHAALWWLVFPLVGPVVLFGYGFVPTFHDYEVTLADGTMVMRSRLLSDRRFRNTLIAGAAVAGGAAALGGAMSEGVGAMQVLGGRKVRVNRRASAFKADGSFNQRNIVGGGARAHMRAGKPVKASRNRRTL